MKVEMFLKYENFPGHDQCTASNEIIGPTLQEFNRDIAYQWFQQKNYMKLSQKHLPYPV